MLFRMLVDTVSRGGNLLLNVGPTGHVEYAQLLGDASEVEGHPGRRILHLVAYHRRPTTQPIQHVDQSWETAGLGVMVLTGGNPVERVYLAPPPVGAHAVVVLEWA